MATDSYRTGSVLFTGDINADMYYYSAHNTNSPAQTEIKVLAAGANTISAPTGGTVPVAVTIIPPAGNTNLITLKGIAGDTGVPLHKTDPTTIALDTTFASFVLNAAALTTGVRFTWS